MTQVFLSHSTLDAEFVDRLVADLRKAKIVVWKAPDSILKGEAWVAAIERGLATSSHFVLVKSPNAVASNWVNFESQIAVAQYNNNKMLVIPIDYVRCDNAPLMWSAFQDINMRDDYHGGLLELIGRLQDEQPKNPPMPVPPETTIINVNISGDVSGLVNVAGRDVQIQQQGADAGRPAPPVEIKSSDPLAGLFLPPNLSDIFPQPWGWCRVPTGEVTLENNAGTFSIDHFFYMAKYPVTYAQYQVFIDAPDGFYNDQWWQELAINTKHRIHRGEQQWKIDNHPRENVSWFEAVAFTRWLSNKTGANIRLPMEWEWQWAAQGVDQRIYPWGNDFDLNLCNIRQSDFGQTTPVTQYLSGSSPFNVLDMSGNVSEWCENIEPLMHSDARDLRVHRGGSWYFNKNVARIAQREWAHVGTRIDYIGFRIACFPPSP